MVVSHTMDIFNLRSEEECQQKATKTLWRVSVLPWFERVSRGKRSDNGVQPKSILLSDVTWHSREVSD